MKERKIHIDVLRIIAIFFVLYVHSTELAAYHYLDSCGRISYWFSLSFHQLSFICNFLFFVLSGALLLQKNESLKDIYCKRVLKYLIVIIVFGFLQYLHTYHHYPEIGFDIKIILKLLYSDNIIGPYWFLHAYLAFIMILPFLRVMAQNINAKLALYLVGGYVLLDGIFPLIELIWDNERIALEIPMFADIIIFPMLGYFLETVWYEKIIQHKLLIIVNVSGILGWILNVWYCYRYMQTGVNFKSAYGLTLLMVIMVYVDVRAVVDYSFKAKGHIKRFLIKAISIIGKGTFTVYLLNNVLMEWTRNIYDVLVNRISWFGAAWVWLNVAILLGTIIYYLYSKVVSLGIYMNKRIKDRFSD